MRLTTALALITLASCVGGPVGGGPAGRDRDGDPEDDDTEPTECVRVDEPVTLRSAADFDALPDGCWDLYSTLRIDGSQVTSLAALGELAGINDLEITGTGLTTLDAPMPLVVYGAVTIKNNARLTDLANLELRREDLTVQVIVDNNAALASLDGVADVTVIDGDLVIANNPKLQGASLRNLEAVAGSTRIANNVALATLDLSRLDVIGRLEIANNTALRTLLPPTAGEITGDLVLRGNRALGSLGSMTSLARVTGNVTIDDNDALASLAAFSTTLQYVTGVLTISNNGALADVGQLSRASGIGAITVVGNPSLSYCRAHEIEHCVPQHGAVTIQGNQDDDNCDCWCQ